jgi:hypothetical protein
MVKLMEEVGELASGIAKGNEALVKDSIGDCAVVLTILAAQSGLTMQECIDGAYEEIKDRKGVMRDGVFIKETNEYTMTTSEPFHPQTDAEKAALSQSEAQE